MADIGQEFGLGAVRGLGGIDRAFQAMMFHTTKPVVDYGVVHMHPWREHWIDAADTARKIFDCIGGSDRVPVSDLLEATGAASRSTLETQLARARKCIEHLGCGLQLREEFVYVTYTGP